MKTNYTKLVMLCLCSLFFWSCEKDEDMLMIKEGTAGTLSASETNLVLKEEDNSKDAVTFSWTKADFGYDAAVNYSLEMDVKGNNFAKAKTIEVGNGLMKTLKVSELNAAANELGMEGFVPGDLEVRVRSSVGAAVEPVYSPTTTLIVTPYLAEPEFPVIYLVGAAAENEWDNTKATPFFRDESDPFIYTLTSNLKAGDFKLLGILGKWGPAWGMGTTNADGSVNLKFRPAESDPDVPNLTGLIPADGYYTITVSLRNNTVKVTPFAGGATAPIFNAIGVVGAFTDWGNTPDIALTKTTRNPHLWNGTVTLPAATELKFRANSDWGTNWGHGAVQENWYGKGTLGSNNIKLGPGTYKVQFNDLTGEYVFVEQ